MVPEGSAGIERTLVAYLKSAGQDRAGHLVRRSLRLRRHSPWRASRRAGCSPGAEDKKTDEQAKLWGGTADEPFDPNYHQKTDTLDHIDRTSLGINGGGVAYAVGALRAGPRRSQRDSGPDDRTRHVLAKK